MTKHSHQELLDMLLEDWLDSIANDWDQQITRDLLLRGFEGLNNYSYGQLLKQAEDAGLVDEEWDDE